MLNRCSFIGYLGNDVEVRSTQDGREIANLSLGVSESWKEKSTGERKSKTEWIRIVIFNENLVTLAKTYLHKGSKIFIEGKMQTRKWTDKDGTDKYSTEVVLQNYDGKLIMLDGKGGDAVPAEKEPKPMGKDAVVSEIDDSIPF